MAEESREAMEAFAANMRILRAYHRLTLREVAERAGLHPDTVSDYERGRGNPRVSTIARLAYAFNADAALLLRRPQGIPDLEKQES